MTIDGNKTYIVAILIMVAGVLFSLNLLGSDSFVAVMAILTGGAFAALRHGVSK